MADYTDAELETGRAIVREWSESGGRGLALSIVIAKALASARSEASGGWVPPAQAKDGRLYAVVYTDEPIVDYDYLVFVNGEWWHPARGSTCDEPGLILELPALPGSPHE